MSDFSHLKRLPLTSFLPRLESGEPLEPEFFDHLLDRIEPPLLPEPAMQALRAELCWFHSRPYATRPPKGLRRIDLSAAIRSLRRDDVPPPLLTCIAQALDAPAPVDRLARPRRFLEERRRQERVSTIRAVHAIFAHYLRTGQKPTITCLAERAHTLDGTRNLKSALLDLTHEVIRDDFRMAPPSLGRLRNIVGNYPHKRATGS